MRLAKATMVAVRRLRQGAAHLFLRPASVTLVSRPGGGPIDGGVAG